MQIKILAVEFLNYKTRFPVLIVIVFVGGEKAQAVV